MIGQTLARLGPWFGAAAWLAALVALAPSPTAAQDRRQDPLALGVDWINVAGPIRLPDLKGKIVLLDFWTYCCINCHHIIPDLEYLEKKYPNELVVIGVHTAKFDAEKDTENIRKKVAEYRIKHPVVNDANQRIWNAFGVESWPTLVLIDTTGQVIGAAPGEGNREVLDKAIAKLIAEAKEQGTLDTTPLHFQPESEKPHNGPLLFPGKVLADAEGKRLFITDTGHNRIVVTGPGGEAIATIGDGNPGLKDGSFEQAQFNRPQGTCLHNGKLYVADTESHAIREIDLEARTVRTVAGTGEQGYRRAGADQALKTALNSPWDVVPEPGQNALFIAMAGPHQIWRLDLDAQTVGVWAGNGREDIRDAVIEKASFAQPSGLATDGKHLYVADSEGSAVRAISLAKPHEVKTIAGTHDLPMGQSLFAFGDKDGRSTSARLQHCLGVAYADGTVYVADSYNNKIKAIDAVSHEVKTLAGSRQAGETDNPPQFFQPGGVSPAGTNLYIADSNNHAIRVLSLTSGQVSTLELKGVSAPRPKASKPRFPNPTVVEVPAVKVAPGGKFQFDVSVALPEGFKINPDAPMPVLVETPEAPDALAAELATGTRINPPRAAFEVPVQLSQPGAAGQTLQVQLSVSTFECKDGAAGLCRVKNYVFKVPVQFEAGGETAVVLKTPARKDN